MVTNESQETLEQSGWEFQSEEIPDAKSSNDVVFHIVINTADNTLSLSRTFDVTNRKAATALAKSYYVDGIYPNVKVIVHESDSGLEYSIMPFVRVKRLLSQAIDIECAMFNVALRLTGYAPIVYSPYGARLTLSYNDIKKGVVKGIGIRSLRP